MWPLSHNRNVGIVPLDWIKSKWCLLLLSLWGHVTADSALLMTVSWTPCTLCVRSNCCLLPVQCDFCCHDDPDHSSGSFCSFQNKVWEENSWVHCVQALVLKYLYLWFFILLSFCRILFSLTGHNFEPLLKTQLQRRMKIYIFYSEFLLWECLFLIGQFVFSPAHYAS